MTEIFAKDCKCVKCGQQAVAFWPIIDPDIQEKPYCWKCLDSIEIQIRLLIAMYEQVAMYEQEKE